MTRGKWLSATVLLSAMCCGAAQKKYIAVSWDLDRMPLDEKLANAETLDRLPFDGMCVMLDARASTGARMSSRDLFTEPEWKREELEPLVAKHRELLSHKCCRESFLETFRAPKKRLAWTDDAAWGRIAHNMEVAAWFARRSGYVGLQMDIEDYDHQEQYVRQKDEMPYDELLKLARQRGREVFSGVFREFPDVRILTFWLMMFDPAYRGEGDVLMMMRRREDLWPAFVNGILDVLPPTACLIDGDEHAYRYEATDLDFHRAATWGRNRFLAFVEPENRMKYLSQVQTSFGVYLDMYLNDPSAANWYFGPVEGSRLTHLRNNLAQATDVATEYVWLYGEKWSWLSGGAAHRRHPGISEKSWDEALPGFYDMVASVRNPAAFAKSMFARFAAGEIKPANVNGACSGEGDAVPSPFSTWKNDAKQRGPGRFFRDGTVGDGDSSSLCAEGVCTGCFMVTLDGLKPGDRYGVSVSAKGASEAFRIDVYGRKLNAGHFKWDRPVISVPVKQGSDEWRHGAGSFTVPDWADSLMFQLPVRQEPGEKCWYDNLAIFKMD